MRLLSYYGDDFTGSTDVMEALASHGVETVLFTRIPSAEQFAQFANVQAVGLAGTSRSESPEWMDENLPPALQWLKSLGARYCHYKVCSTFDSSPAIGSIGRASEIGARIFGQAMIPLVVGAPQLRRYTFAANLFAAYQSEIYRIDRHPVMAKHPVTPMREADLRLHLALQTVLPVTLASQDWPKGGIALLDVHGAATQLAAGELLLELGDGFVVGSSGVEYALLKALQARGSIQGTASFPALKPVERTMVVSGSVSPTTERQILHAIRNGFEAISVSALELAGENAEAIIAEAATHALRALEKGQSPLVHTALGHATDEGQKLNAIKNGRRRIGEGLGRILKQVVRRTGLRRVLVAGGDSSSHALSQLDIYALQTRMPIPETPGSPLCSAASADPQLDGIEIALKGGQVGLEDYFVRMKEGRL
jgi:uncharacterized protein YgbK (DUF1537 family)